jgi:transaldolase
MKQSPLLALGALGQSIWLDYIRRDLLTSGALARLMADDGLLGLTSNPAIFAKALEGGPEYQDEVDRLRRAGRSALDIY